MGEGETSRRRRKGGASKNKLSIGQPCQKRSSGRETHKKDLNTGEGKKTQKRGLGGEKKVEKKPKIEGAKLVSTTGRGPS